MSMAEPSSFDSVPICLSGGAEGADVQWGMCAGMAGHQVIHWTFRRHRSEAPPSEIVELPRDLLLAADPFVERANLTLKRHFPTNSDFVNSLLRRNWYQVRDADAVYAVSDISKGQVSGGTAWATQMFIDRHEGQPCRAYVFCQKTDRWYAWEGHWKEIDTPPVPDGIWAGVGSRKLLDNGKAAIRSLLGYDPARAA